MLGGQSYSGPDMDICRTWRCEAWWEMALFYDHWWNFRIKCRLPRIVSGCMDESREWYSDDHDSKVRRSRGERCGRLVESWRAGQRDGWELWMWVAIATQIFRLSTIRNSERKSRSYQEGMDMSKFEPLGKANDSNAPAAAYWRHLSHSTCKVLLSHITSEHA